MKVQHIHIGGWFQRTSLHLSEVHDFLMSGTSSLALDPVKLASLHDALELRSVARHLDGLEYLLVETAGGITLRLFEDGLIVLRKGAISSESLESEFVSLASYYDKKLSPVLGYLFSLGAPVPKELANIKTVFPYVVVVQDATREDIAGIMKDFHQEERFEQLGEGFELYRGKLLHIINQTGEPADLERLIEEQVFLREFKSQLHRYLNLHRIIWERIAEVKERGAIVGRDIGAFRSKIDGYAKTINLIEARIRQMGSYLSTRERIANADPRLKRFTVTLEYRYESLRDTLSYVNDIWAMTKNYVASAKELFMSLESQATSSSVRNLTVVTSMGVGATLIGLFTTTAAPHFTLFGVGYFAALATIGYASDKVVKWFSRRKSYAVSPSDYDKDIK